MEQVGAAALPVMVGLIVLFGYAKGVPVFDTFLAGAREGLRASLKLLPTLVGLIVAVTMLRASGLLELLCGLLDPVAQGAGGFPRSCCLWRCCGLFPAAAPPPIRWTCFSSSVRTAKLGKSLRCCPPPQRPPFMPWLCILEPAATSAFVTPFLPPCWETRQLLPFPFSLSSCWGRTLLEPDPFLFPRAGV